MENNEKFSDKEWRNYWDDLMLKSKKPVPWGTIVEEKPDQDNISTTEDTKLLSFNIDTLKSYNDSKD
jgi:hypothetical protein